MSNPSKWGQNVDNNNNTQNMNPNNPRMLSPSSPTKNENKNNDANIRKQKQHQRRRNKRKKKKQQIRSKKINKNSNKVSYNPPTSMRADHNIFVQTKLTQILVKYVMEQEITNISDICHYVYKSIAIQLKCKFTETNHNCIALSLGLHDIQRHLIYFIITKNNKSNENDNEETKDDHQYQYEMEGKYWFHDEIVNINGIYIAPYINLNQKFAVEIKAMDMMTNEILIPLFKATEWSKIDVFKNRKSHQRIRAITMTEDTAKDIFASALGGDLENDESEQKNDDDDADMSQIRSILNPIPIIMFDVNGNYWIEFVIILRIENDPNVITDIGVSLKYDHDNLEFKVAGIHLNKENIKKQHELLIPYLNDHHKCHCLDYFKSCIDELKINKDINEERQRLLSYKSRCEKQKLRNEEMEKFMLELLKNTKNIDPSLRQKAMDLFKLEL